MELNLDVVLAFALILLAAAMNGAYAIPLRYMKRWNWENTWAAWTLLSMMLLPSVAAVLSVQGLGATYLHTAPGTLALMGVFGSLWGLGVLMIGMSFPLIGVAVGNAIALGCSAAVGNLLPLFGRQSNKLGTPSGNLILTGVAVMLVGVATCGWAGKERERRQGSAVPGKGKAVAGALLAGIGGSFGSLLYIALAYGDPILDAMRASNPGNTMVANAVWVPVLFAGGIPGLLYCLWLMRRNGSRAAYGMSATGGNWPLVVGMSVLWFGSVLLYGVGVLRIGRLGPVIGWPVFMSGAVVSSFLWGALAHEWRKSGGKSVALMLGGIALLMGAMMLFAKAGS